VQRPDLIDPKAELSQDEYKRHLIKNDDFLKESGAEIPAVPEPMPIMAPPPTGEDEKLISLSVTENVPLREVFVEIARKADMDLEVDPGVKGGIIFRAKDRPFSEVINRICDLADLRCSIKDRILKISLDTPYIVNYPLDFLNLIRSNNGEETISTKVLSATVSGGTSSGSGTSGTPGSTPGSSSGSSNTNDSFTNGSKNNLKSSYEGDMWKSIEEGVKAIMANYTGAPPGILLPSGEKLAAGTAGTAAGAAKPAAGNSPDNFVIVNKQAGVITVLATDKKHREVKKYLDSVRAAESAQVLIEAKVVEVDLDDEYSSGIKWDAVGKNFTATASAALSSANAPSVPFFSTTVLPQNLFGTNTSLDSAVSFTQQFGTTRTLSSPRINAMNNQQAVLTFAENSVYFTVSFSQTQTTTATTPQTFSGISSSPQVVPIGVIMTLQPSIDLDTNEVTMNIRPTISSIVDKVNDPAVPLIEAELGAAAANLPPNAIPEVQVRELDSVLKIKSGEVMVIGGLMQEKQVGNDQGIPGLMQLPFVGNAFKASSHTTQTTETVIFIKATIVPSHGGVKDYDRDFYETYQTKRS